MSPMERPRPIIDLRIPLPIIFALLVQTSAFVWWQASMQQEMRNRVASLEQWVSQNNSVLERVIRVEEKVGGLKEQSGRIEQKLDQALDRRK